MKRLILEALLDAIDGDETVALVTNLDTNEQHLVFQHSTIAEDGTSAGRAAFELPAKKALAEDRNQLLELAGSRYAIRVFGPQLRLILIGAVHIAQVLHQMAALIGYETTIVDPRLAFASAARFPGVDLVCLWPDEALKNAPVGTRCAVVTLTHDAKIDDPALAIALRSDAYYIGALGSRRTHAARLVRLAAEGFAEQELQRIHAPVGLPLGGRAPAEIATAILADIIQTRYQQTN